MSSLTAIALLMYVVSAHRSVVVGSPTRACRSGNDSASYVRDGTKYDGAKPQGEQRQQVGVRQVVTPDTKTYTNAMIAAQQQFSARGDSWAEANSKFSGCTSMDTVIDAQGNTCGGASFMSPNSPTSSASNPA